MLIGRFAAGHLVAERADFLAENNSLDCQLRVPEIARAFQHLSELLLFRLVRNRKDVGAWRAGRRGRASGRISGRAAGPETGGGGPIARSAIPRRRSMPAAGAEWRIGGLVRRLPPAREKIHTDVGQCSRGTRRRRFLNEDDETIFSNACSSRNAPWANRAWPTMVGRNEGDGRRRNDPRALVSTENENGS